ncbi:SGNH/GDSL hydrolase family protein [Pseudomonas sp. Marseille-QA0892]
MSADSLPSAADMGVEPAIAPGANDRYWRGDKTWQVLASAVRGVVLTGLSTSVSTALAATDTVIDALGKLQAQLGNKVDKESGKGLSSNDYTSAEKTKLANAFLEKVGGEMTGTIVSAALNSLIQKGGAGKGIIHRVDSTNYYFLITDTNDGTFNSLRPLFINLTTGMVYMRQGLDVAGGLKANTFTGNGAGLTGVKADVLANARTINGIAFDGSTDVNLPGVFKDITSYGASTSATAAINLTAVNNTIANERNVIVPPQDYQLSAFPTNPLGKQYQGEGRLLNGKRLVNPTTDINRNIFGQEYLNPFFEKILDKTASVKVVFSGDSTTENWGQGSYQIDKIFTRIAADKGHAVQAWNKGVGGAHTEEWRTQYLSADLALNPDLYVVRWGLNDVTNNRTIEQYAQSLRAGLQAIRSQREVKSLAIVLMAPNSTSEYSANRDERWEEQTSKVCKQAARDFGCAFIDTYAIWADSRAGAGVWLDGANGVGGIHPKPVFNMTIASLLADVVFPSGLRARSLPSSVKTVTAATLPSEYPIGYSLFELTGYDYPATAATLRSMDGYCSQTIFGHPPTDGWTPQVTTRFGRCDGTNNYWYSKAYDRNGVTLSLVNGWAHLPDGSGGRVEARAKLASGVVTLNGIITGGTRGDDTLLTTLPPGLRPRNPIICAQAAMQTTAGIGTCYLHISNSGEVTIWRGVSAGNGWVSLDGISFEVGA